MSNFRKLVEQMERTSDLLDLRKERVHDIATGVLSAMGILRVGVEKVQIHSDGVYVCYGWSRRGLFDEDDRTIPVWVFEADDPSEAAKEYAAQLTAVAKDRERQEKVDKLKRLQEELAND